MWIAALLPCLPFRNPEIQREANPRCSDNARITSQSSRKCCNSYGLAWLDVERGRRRQLASAACQKFAGSSGGTSMHGRDRCPNHGFSTVQGNRDLPGERMVPLFLCLSPFRLRISEVGSQKLLLGERPQTKIWVMGGSGTAPTGGLGARAHGWDGGARISGLLLLWRPASWGIGPADFRDLEAT